MRADLLLLSASHDVLVGQEQTADDQKNTFNLNIGARLVHHIKKWALFLTYVTGTCKFHTLQHLKPLSRPLGNSQMKNKRDSVSSQINGMKTIFMILKPGGNQM